MQRFNAISRRALNTARDDRSQTPRRQSRHGWQSYVKSQIRANSTQQAPKSIHASRKANDPRSTLASLIEDGKKITASSSIPDELSILELLEKCYTLSQVLVFGKPSNVMAAQKLAEEDDTPASSLLNLDDDTSSSDHISVTSSSTSLTKAFRQKASTDISELIYHLLLNPKVFITPDMLQIYVRIQCLLGKPEYLPEVFHLYATKPIPRPGPRGKGKANRVIFKSAWPRSPKNAIPLSLSDAALEAAIAKKDLPLALTTIDTTVAAPAFRINKLLRKASLPLAALSVTPFCGYVAATYIANWQNTYDTSTATYLSLAGIMAYLGTTATMGFVALTTSNDQMERVVWAPGLRLRDRWLREEERSYFDRVAMAWGFKERWRRGEERGEEWEALREFVGMRNMVLDKSDLIEGME